MDNEIQNAYPSGYNNAPEIKEAPEGHFINEMSRDTFLESDEVSDALNAWFLYGGDQDLLDRIKYLKQLAFEKASEELEKDLGNE